MLKAVGIKKTNLCEEDFTSQLQVGQGYRNGYLFPDGENIVLRETDPFFEESLGATDIRLPKP